MKYDIQFCLKTDGSETYNAHANGPNTEVVASKGTTGFSMRKYILMETHTNIMHCTIKVSEILGYWQSTSCMLKGGADT